MKHFSAEGALATLLPYQGGLRFRFPAWLALVMAIPLLGLAALVAGAGSVVLLLLFGVPGVLFLILWAMSRRTSSDSGLIRIHREQHRAIFTDRDGSEASVCFGRFLSVRIEKVVTGKTYSWRAVLYGSEGCLVLETGSVRSALIDWVTPVAHWLGIPVELSNQEIDGLAWLLTPRHRLNPYPDDAAKPFSQKS